MKTIIRWRWPILIIWLTVTAVLTIIQPDTNKILHERGQNPLTTDSRSVVATGLLKKMTNAEGNSNIIVFSATQSLSAVDMGSIEAGVKGLRDKQAALGISNMIDPFASPEAKSSLVSSDHTTVMVSFTLDLMGRSVDDIELEFREALGGVTVPYYLSGEDFIQNDYLKASTSGVEKSAALTVIFILVVLIIMFRSIIIPFISLLAVGFSYLVSMGIAAQLIDKLEFPVTSVTQMLLVLILFGIGTDYNILLFNRFKEELAHGKSTDEAIIVSYQTAGKTILYSILTVFFAFACLSFSNFGIYQSGNVVAIGTIILLLEIVTLTPFVMKTLGAKLFWPSRSVGGHKENKLMGGLAASSVKRPMITIMVIAALLAPVFLTSGQKLSFDQIGELGEDHPSTKGFSIVADKFSRGQALPTTVVIEGRESLDNNDAFAVIDGLTNSLKLIPGIKSVSSITQPTGEPIDGFYISSQTAELTKGIDAASGGVTSIKGGLEQMQGGLSSADFSQAAQLSAGTAQVKDGYAQVASALGKLAAGVDEGAAGAAGLQAGIAELRSGLAQVASQTEQLATGLEQLRQGYGQTLDGYAELTSGLPGVQAGLESMNGLIDKLGQSHRELSQDADYATLRTTGQQLETALASMTSGLGAIKQNVAKLHTSFDGANDGLKQLHAAQTQMVNGMKELEQGAGQLAAGLKQGSAGNKELAASMAKLNTALADIQGGQEQLNAGLGGLSSGLSEMKTGLQKSSQGLGDIADGLHKTSAFITQIGATKTFFIPKEAMSAPAFAQAKDVYLSKDRTMTKLLIILDEDPYSPAALDVIEQMNATLDTGIEGTVLKGAVYGAAGPSSTTYDMNNAQLASFNSTAVIVIISVFLVLLLVIRSFWPSIFMIASLIAAYYVGMGAAKLVTAYVIGADGVSSFVPFFSFIVIVAVGVDYGIFLMMRYKEYGHFDPREAIVRSARSVGGVILSAMVILGGTFATLIPSGLVLLIELASAVIAGLVVLTFVLLPMLVPALMALPGMMRDRKLKRNGGGPEGNNG